MDFSYPEEAETFRAELRTWLEANLDDRTRSVRSQDHSQEDRIEIIRAWNRVLADAGYAALWWPVEYGGRDAGVMEQVVWAEEMHRSGAPGTLNPIGIANIAPSIMMYGTDEQKSRHLCRMLRGDDIWCQGFSEPDAGSDLASLRMTAVRDGDHYIVNGQKVWNTFGDIANYCELLVRTDPKAAKHAGITCLLVDMTISGIEVRPLTTITGDTEFSELFFTDVRVPVEGRLGPENEGWKVAMTTLNNERGGVAALHLQVRERIGELIEASRGVTLGAGKASEDPVTRQKLARLYLEGEYLKFLSDRAISATVSGRQGAEGSLVKLVWSHVEQQRVALEGEILGAEAITGNAGRGRLSARSLSIAGGTTQVNKNVVARRVLGLPKGQ